MNTEPGSRPAIEDTEPAADAVQVDPRELAALQSFMQPSRCTRPAAVKPAGWLARLFGRRHGPANKFREVCEKS